MEREGIYYYFSQKDKKEKLVITDNAASHKDVSAVSKIPYSPPSGMVPYYQEVIQSMICRQRKLPNKVILRDYNYRRPSLELKVEATVDVNGHGDVYYYGEHFKTPEEGNHLARIRAEELLCRECIFYGESTAANLSAGYLFEMQDHYRESYNRQYLVVGVEHKGHQMIAGLSGQTGGLSQGERQMEYSNRFTAIPAGIQFRPERNAVQPKFYGTLNAIVDASGNGEYAEIDDQGRYKVILPFDRSGIGGGRASRWIRMAQPYAGNDYGMHFPLHRGTEVLLTFIDGDPDRPIIAGSVPNLGTSSPVTAGNLTKNMIRSASGNEYHMEDKKGSETIYTRAVKDQTTDVANDRTKIVGRNEEMQIGGDKSISVGANHQESIGADKSIRVGANHQESIGADKSISVGANHSEKIAANMSLDIGAARTVNIAAAENKSVGGGSNTQIRGAQSVNVSAAASETVGAAKALSIGGAYQISVGALMNETVAGLKAEEVGISKKVAVGVDFSETVGGTHKLKSKKVVIEADKEIRFKTGTASIVMTSGGDIVFKGTKISGN